MCGGGAERVISELVKYLANKNCICIIITLDEEEVLYDIPLQVKLITIGKLANNKYIDKFFKYLKLRKKIYEVGPDVVLALPEDIGIFVIPTLFGLHIPIVISERNNPWVMPWKKSTRLMRKTFYPFAAGFIFQTEKAASFFSSKIRAKSIVLPNPLDLNRIPEPCRTERVKEIIGAGRLDKQKNFTLLIKAFSIFHELHPEYVLKIYGDGPQKDELINYAATLLPINTYCFPGKSKKLLVDIKCASMFVLSSDFEGMPNVIIEAMAIGLPVISTDCPSGGSAELIENGINGLLVPVGDVESLCNAMCMIAESEELGKMLSANSQKIKMKLDSTIIAEQWRKYLSDIYKENTN